MASQDLKQRHREESAPAVSDDRRAKRTAMAKRGLRSLSVFIAAPLALSLLATWISPAADVAMPWVFHLGSALAAGLMGLAAWLVWAEGGFHRQPSALPLYLFQMGLGLAWGPLVLGAGAAKIGMGVAAALAAALVACAGCFGRANPVARDLVMPCIAWAAFLVLFSFSVM